MKTLKRKFRARFAVLFAVLLVAALLVALPFRSRTRAAASGSSSKIDMYARRVPDVNTNLLAAVTRQATAAQLAVIDNFKSAYGTQTTVRWNPFSGSVDVMTGFHTAPSTETPENTARAFINQNNALFGADAASLKLISQQEALGGYLLRFQQQANGVDVAGGGVGFLMNSNKQIRMVMGSTFRDVNVSNSSVLDGAAAVARAEAAIAQFAVSRPANVEALRTPAFDEIAKQIAPALRAPRLNIFPTADGYRLAWNVLTFSRNPFGVFVSQVDAETGEILSRESLAHYQSADVLPYQADIFPNHPTLKDPDTGELLKDAGGVPVGMERVQLRGFNPGTNATGVAGTISGTHALIKNVLATQQPFAQSALGTYYFRQENAPLESQPNEADDLAEPAEHFDESNVYFFINYLLEYVDDLHKRDDSVHSHIGQGDFPDTYPNYDRPLVGLPHFPNDDSGTLGSSPDTSSPDALVRSTLGFDNAFSLPVIETVDTPAGPQKIVVNPTVYGHGYLLNDTAKDGAVCYHEGMHSISTPIAGLEGAPEGSALNEAQADLWAYTITDAEAIGEYAVNGAGYRKYIASLGRDPNSLAWIRSVHSTLKYSQLGTRGAANDFEEHRDGEIFVATQWDLRHLMITAQPQMQFLRPAFKDGQPTRQISLGQETWERDFLGSLYILGLTAPDTFVKARDAMIEADRILYPTDPSDLDAPGQHEALIWQVFASHEIGANAQAPFAGRQTISTAVPQFALDQAHLSAPQGVSIAPASMKSVRVSWQPVTGALAYEVFKRKIGTAGQRQFKGAPGREYFEGDNQKTGWSHVAYVTADQASYEDKGIIQEFFAPAGIKSTNDANGFNEMFDTEYAVRVININANKQAGASDLSASASMNYSYADVTSAIQSAVSNVSFANGKFEFDQTLKNNGITGADPAAYSPLNFQVISISNSTVTTANSDNGGDGRSKPASFIYNQTLNPGDISAARHLVFNDPGAQMFTFDALVTARVRGASVAAQGSQSYDGDGGGRAPLTLTSTTDTYTGIIVVGSAGSKLVNGVDYVDVPFVAKDGAFGVTGTLDALPNGGAAPDLDFELLDDQGHVLQTSGNLGPNEQVGGAVTPGKTYIYRVVGYASGPCQFTITSEQYINTTATGPNSGGGSSSSSSFLPAITGVSTPAHLVRFTVNPLTKAVTFKVLK
jgi:Fungalysin metallopeptidase (M36)